MKVSWSAGLLFCSGIWNKEVVSQDAQEGPKTLDLEALKKMVTSLRGEDFNIVRPSPTEETSEQQKIICPDAIPALVATVTNVDLGLVTQGKAAEALALCTTNHPENREAIGNVFHTDNSFKHTVHSGLVRLIRNGRTVFADEKAADNYRDESKDAKEAATAVANAAEAIWILSFNSPLNHAGFVEAGAVSALSEVIIDPHCGQERHICSLPKMWSAAALQNLAASYCASETGHCWWEWTEEKDGKDVLKIHEQHGKLTVDAQKVRTEIMHYADEAVLHQLVDYACAGPVHLPHHALLEEENNYHAWPSLAEVSKDTEGDESSPAIVPWAAVGLLRNLALAGPDARESLLEFELLEECLCEMVRSPDALESGKAEEALYNLAVPGCPPPYDESCQNFAGWKNAETGETCEDYEENNWCVEFGFDEDADGVQANDACCACGGGKDGGDEL